MKQYIKYIKSDDYVRIGNLTLPTDAREFGNMTGEEISDEINRRIRRTQEEKEEEERLAREAREAEEKRIRDAERAKINYAKAFDELDTNMPVEDQLEYIFDALVPPSGQCDNLGGELARAMMKVLYRDSNDGDVFYQGYGLETCAGDMAFVCDKTDDIDEDGNSIYVMAIDIAEGGLEGEEYTSALDDIVGVLVRYLREHPELFGQDTVDCRSYKSRTIDEFVDATPKYEFEADISGDLERYIDNDCISYDDVEEWLDGLTWNWGGEVSQRALDWFQIVELDKEQYALWENNFYDALMHWLDDLEEEFPNYGEPEDEY